ncbi:MAG: amino acid ABC transporter permease [Bacillota bacterium]|nr:amino acid ABC transporter permease [Bacillota bacterium]
MTLFNDIYTNIFYSGRIFLYLSGLLNTLIIAFFAAVLGVIIGTVIAVIKVYAAESGALKPLSVLCDAYLAFIRGTPMAVQLLITYFVIFGAAPATFQIPIAIIAFGVNSGAYVAEIIRAGIQSIDRGQTEAGRSLGLTKNMTMRYIVMPQAVKNILPAIFNELITLVKETAIVSLIAIPDLTMAATMIRSRTFNAYVPLFFIALVYLSIVLLLTSVQRRIERRLAQNDQR